MKPIVCNNKRKVMRITGCLEFRNQIFPKRPRKMFRKIVVVSKVRRVKKVLNELHFWHRNHSMEEMIPGRN